MYSQANVRVESVLRPPTRALPSVIVDTEKVLREADGPTKRAVPRPAVRGGWKGVRPGVRLKNQTDNFRTMFESRISAERAEKLPFPQNLRISSWSYDMEGHANKCVERHCEFANQDDSTTLQSINSMHR